MKAIELELFRHLMVSIAEEMGVRVSQAGQDGGVAEIDEAITRGMVRLCHGTDADNLSALDHNGLIGESLAAANVEQFAGVDHHATGSRSGGVLGLCLSEWGQQSLGHQPLENEFAQRHTDCGNITLACVLHLLLFIRNSYFFYGQ